jgi:hypothetical protein
MLLLGPLGASLGREATVSRPPVVPLVGSTSPDAIAFRVGSRPHPKRHRSDSRPLRMGLRSGRATVRIFKRPQWDAPSRRVAARNPIGQNLVLPIDRSARGGRWLRVLLPERPNGSTGWIVARSALTIALRHRVVVDLSARSLHHFRGRRLIHRFRVGIGTPSTPTPTGVTFVWARVPQPSPSGPYGVFALGLGAFSPVLTDWPGGGRSAIHGTADPGDRGRAVSHGCVRVYNPDMTKLAGIPMGTPVVITQ